MLNYHSYTFQSKLVISKPPENPSAPEDEEATESGQDQGEDELPKDARIIINLLSYEKRGEGINAYLVYKIATHVCFLLVLHLNRGSL